MTITEFERNKICHDKKFKSELFKNADSLTWKNCFSVLRTTNMLLRPRIPKLDFYDLNGTKFVQRSSLDSTNKDHKKDILILENQCQEEEILSIDGIRFICFFSICLIFVNYVNMDMIIKNKWKSLEMIETQRILWIFVASVYICIDYLLLLSAFL
jgi:hypothetical protein